MRAARRGPPGPSPPPRRPIGPACDPRGRPLRTPGRVGQFQHDTAYVVIGEGIVAGELQVVHGALHVEEEGVAAPAREEAVVAGLRHPRLPSYRDGRPLDDDLPALARPGGLRALGAASVAVCPPPSEAENRTR